MTKQLISDICIIGGGPGGAMLAMLLARQGIKTVLVERAIKNEREFRGETISPDSVAIFKSLGVMPYIDQHGYIQTKKWQIFENNKRMLEINFDRFNYDVKYSIDLPQPVLIDALLTEAKKHDSFTYQPGTRCESLIIENNTVVGVKCLGEGLLEIRSRLVVGADGRYGKVRKLANLDAKIKPLKRDILWFMLPRPKDWEDAVKLYIRKNQHIVALPTYPNLLRIGFNIPAGQYKKVRQEDISYLHNCVADLEPALADAVKDKVKSWSDTTLLDVFTMEVPTWSKDGLILLGDAAHTLSPVLGQGVNHAIKDALDLSAVIAEELKHQTDKVILSSAFKDYIKRRKYEVDFVQRFQMRQESMLALSSNFKTKLRQLIYRIMNKSSLLQSLIWERILYCHQKQLIKQRA